MNKIIKFIDYSKWYLLAFGLLLVAFLVRAIGASSKQKEYKQVIEKYAEKKRDELLQRHKDLSDTIISGETETIDQKEAEIISLEKEIEVRKTDRNRAIDSRATSRRLEQMGLK